MVYVSIWRILEPVSYPKGDSHVENHHLQVSSCFNDTPHLHVQKIQRSPAVSRARFWSPKGFYFSSARLKPKSMGPVKKWEGYLGFLVCIRLGLLSCLQCSSRDPCIHETQTTPVSRCRFGLVGGSTIPHLLATDCE